MFMQLRGLEQAWLELTQTCWEGLLALGMSLLLLLMLLLLLLLLMLFAENLNDQNVYSRFRKVALTRTTAHLRSAFPFLPFNYLDTHTHTHNLAKMLRNRHLHTRRNIQKHTKRDTHTERHTERHAYTPFSLLTLNLHTLKQTNQAVKSYNICQNEIMQLCLGGPVDQNCMTS